MIRSITVCTCIASLLFLIPAELHGLPNPFATLYRLDGHLEGLRNIQVRDSTEYFAPGGWYYQIQQDSGSEVVLKFIKHRQADHKIETGEVRAGKLYSISKTSLEKAWSVFVQGVSVGALAVPFKYRMATPSARAVITNNASIGASVGMKFGGWPGFFSQPLVFIAFTRIPVAAANGATPTERNGLTLGTGVALEIKGGAQFGIIVGWDQVADGDDPNWDYQGRPWLSIGINYKLISG